jgi:hypothetical protein
VRWFGAGKRERRDRFNLDKTVIAPGIGECPRCACAGSTLVVLRGSTVVSEIVLLGISADSLEVRLLHEIFDDEEDVQQRLFEEE